jgi:hypothetical protein
VLQHTPLRVTDVFLSEATFPPDDADVGVIEVMPDVVTTGKDDFLLHEVRQSKNEITKAHKMLIE